ncbi:sugar ABC transporter permease [Microbacterium sp. zg-Y818]|uniref:carbohydrate ABC transporter permease n=1 Tax=unclassified Microbacterium TaxID=2609290 RepID=UPI00214BAE9E|nr:MULTISPECIES: sugar ABC transporter permease [unclassified Microbacterium]MCR2801290.1 sugar ABC transporter permease [Microbacterium sp. zg.Y818]WIM21122.1 sugar ABC transporter permease [Microbacterium sp. zg-Y818]
MTPLTPAPRRVGFSRKLSRWDIKVSPYLYISPFFLSFAVFGFFPIIFNIWVALHEWDRRLGQGEFVGLDNFAWVLNQPAFWTSLQNTFSIFVLALVPQLILSLLIAAILDQNLRTKTFWRMSILIPFVVMPVASAMIFSQVFGQFGLVTPLLHDLGWFTDVDSPFFHNRFLSHVAIATMIVFRWTGYNALIFLAAMQAVPRDLYEAATIDGAGRARQFFSVTIPSIRPTMIFVILTMTIGGLQVFDEARVFDGSGSGGTGQGGSDDQWLTTVLYLFNLGFGDWQDRMGQAAAVAWLFALVIIVFTLLNFFLTRAIADSGSRPTRASRAAAKKLVAQVRAEANAPTTHAERPTLTEGSQR